MLHNVVHKHLILVANPSQKVILPSFRSKREVAYVVCQGRAHVKGQHARRWPPDGYRHYLFAICHRHMTKTFSLSSDCHRVCVAHATLYGVPLCVPGEGHKAKAGKAQAHDSTRQRGNGHQPPVVAAARAWHVPTFVVCLPLAHTASLSPAHDKLLSVMCLLSAIGFLFGTRQTYFLPCDRYKAHGAHDKEMISPNASLITSLE